jgi:hypothetical protein
VLEDKRKKEIPEEEDKRWEMLDEYLHNNNKIKQFETSLPSILSSNLQGRKEFIPRPIISKLE